MEEIKEPIVEPIEEIEHTEVTPEIIEENTKLSGEPTIYEGNVILSPASSDELSKEDSNDTPIELATKAIEIIDSLKDEEEQETNKEESQEENNNEEELEVEKTGEANSTLISKIKEKMKKYSPKSLISNFKDKHKEQELTEEESQKENNDEQELKVKEVSKANPTLISKIKEKMKKYGVKVLIGLSITTLLAIAISNPITFIPLIEGGSLIGLGLNAMNESEEKKKIKRKGKFLTR